MAGKRMFDDRCRMLWRSMPFRIYHAVAPNLSPWDDIHATPFAARRLFPASVGNPHPFCRLAPHPQGNANGLRDRHIGNAGQRFCCPAIW